MSILLPLAVLTTALLFGGTALYAFAFAAFLFATFAPDVAGSALRKAFPWFYAFVCVTAAIAALLWWPRDAVSAAVMAGIVVTAFLARQWLMPAINRATDTGERQRFRVLHGLSVIVTLGHLVAAGWVLVRVV